MRAREPDHAGYAEQGGVKIGYKVFGAGRARAGFVPASPISHSRVWKAQVPSFSRHGTVVTFDGRGNGRSDRPAAPAAFRDEEHMADVLAVMDAAGVARAVLINHCHSTEWGFLLAANHPRPGAGHRASSLSVAPRHPHTRDLLAHYEDIADDYQGWRQCNRHFWEHGGYRRWVEFFFSQQLPRTCASRWTRDGVRLN